MKKILTATLAIAMGASIACAFTSCKKSNNKDAETAKKAIASVQSIYGSKAAETPVDYDVLGETKVDGNIYTVNWTVSTEDSSIDLSQYVSVGEMGEDKQVPVSITQTDIVVEYSLNASVTVGKATESTSFARKIPALLGEVTADKPITVAKVIEVASGLKDGEWYKENGAEKLVYVEGYVTDVGTAEETRIKNVKIADSLDAKDSINIGSLNFNEKFPKGSYLNVGDKVVVKAFIEKFNSKASLYSSNEYLEDGKKVYPEIAKIEKVARTDAQIVADAKAAVALESDYSVGEVTLPGEYQGATLTWSVKEESTIVSITDNKMTITEPEEDTRVAITVTIKSGEVTDTKDFNIKVIKTTDKGTLENPYTAAEVIAIAQTLNSGKYYSVNGEPKQIYVKGYITVMGDYDATNKRYNNTYIADDKDAEQAGSLLVYTLSLKENTALVNEGDLAKGMLVTFCGYIENYNEKAEITYFGKDVVTAVAKEDDRNDAQIVAAAKESVKLNESYTEGEVTLPEALGGATLTWAIKGETTVVTLDGNKMTVTNPEADTEVTLTVTIKCGEAEDTKDITFTVAKKAELALDHQGTEEDPFSVADVIKIGATLDGDSKEYYGANGTPQDVYVKGYVTDTGKYDASNKRFNYVYIADVAGGETTVQVYTITVSADSAVKQQSDLILGTLIVVHGYIQQFGETLEITYSGSNVVTVVSSEDTRTDAQKVEAAKAAITLAETYKTGTVTLPATNNGATLTWAVKSGTNVTIDGTTMTVTNPEADTDVTLTVTIKSGDVTDTKDITIKIEHVALFEAGSYNIYVDLTSVSSIAKKYYLTGSMDGNFAATTDDITEAAEVKIEAVEGGYTLKVVNNNKYIEIVEVVNNGKTYQNVAFKDTSSAVWTYNYTVKVFTWALGSENYYLGTYTNNGTTRTSITASKVSFISGDSASTVGKTQFPVGYEKLTVKTDAEKVAAAKEALTLEEKYFAGKATLPAEKGEATLTWAIKGQTNAVTLNGYEMTVAELDADASVTLIATITCGDASVTKEITFTVVKASTKGTLTDPYTAAEVIEIANGLASEAYYSENGAPKKIYVKGYITVLGTPNDGNTRLNNTYIADVAGTAKADSLNVYTISFVEGSALTKADDLKVGDLVIIYGYIENYKGTPEITYYGDDENSAVIAATKVEDTRPEEEKGKQALEALNIPETITNDLVLESVLSDVTLKIKSSSDESVIALNGKVTRGTSDVVVKLVVAAYIDEEEVAASEEITVTVKAVLNVPQSINATLDFSVVANCTEHDDDKQVWQANGITFTNEKSNSTTKVSIENNNGPYGHSRCYKGSSIKVECSAIDTIIFNCLTFPSGSNTVDSASNLVESIGKQAGVTVSQNGTVVTVTFDYACTEFAVSELAAQVRLSSIQVKAVMTGTDAEKVAAAKEEVTLNAEYEAGTYDLPATSNGATLTWAVKSGTNVTIDGTTMTVTEPESDNVPVVITVTIQSGDVTETKDINITVLFTAPVEETNYGSLEAPLSVTEALAITEDECKNDTDVTADIVYMTGIVSDVPTIDKYSCYTYHIKDVTDSTKTITVYTKHNLRENVATPTQNDLLVISGYIKNYYGTIEFALNDDTYVYVESNTRGTSTITLGAHDGAEVTGLPETATNDTEVTFTVSVADNKELVSVKVAGNTIESTEGTYKFTVAGNMTVTVETKDKGAAEAEVLYTLSTLNTTGTNSSYTSNCDMTVGGIKWNLEGNSQQKPWRLGGKSSNTVNADRKLTGKTAISGRVTKLDITFDAITITVNSVTLKVYSSDPTAGGATEVSSIAITDYAASKTVTVMADKDWTNCYYQLVFNLTATTSGNQFVSVSTIAFYGFAA